MKLHLGCGSRIYPGYTHVDVVPWPHVDLVCAVDRMPMVPDDAAAVVVAVHVLEHFPRRETARVLAEWTRVLAPGGTLRVAVPDFAELAELYRDTGRLDLIAGALMGRGDYLYNLHYNVFDYATLRAAMEGAGLADVRRYNWRETDHADVDDYSQAYYPHLDKEHGRLLSLNMQGTKPG